MAPRDFSKIEEVYHAAVRQPPGEREAFLKKACHGDELLLEEVRSLLSHEEEAKGLLEEPAGEAATQRLALVRGTHLGPYEILEPLGAGGMGEVYRAKDTRLGRTVAIKVLPLESADDPERRARFEREARAISALAHPNICTLHDIGEENGHTFLVMEHLEGQTLAERLKRGTLPLEESLEIAAQIADGLSAAHKKDIIHRDLKPGNVVLTKTGARILDFGLARLASHGERPAVENASSAPTEPAPLTGAGTVLGTLPYMAPEQVQGDGVDARTDIWALGAILYEMLTGRRAFEGSSPVSLVAAIVERQPAPLADKQPLAPPSLERLVRRCLAKDPDARWDTAHDLAEELRWIGEAGAGTGVDTGQGARGAPRWAISAMASLVVVAFAAGLLAERLWLRPPQKTPATPVVRSQIDLTSDGRLLGPNRHHHPHRTELAVSPDGRLLAWAASPDGSWELSALRLRRLDTGETTQLPGTEGASQPFFSPDGRWIGFCARRGPGEWQLRKIPAEGGLAVDLADLPWRPKGAWWGLDEMIYLGSLKQLGPSGIHRLPAEGGTPREITIVDRTREADHQLPVLLPGGRTLMFTTVPRVFGMKARVEAILLEGGERKVVVEDGGDSRYLPSGHLVFVRRGVLMAAPFDAHRVELTGPPVPVVDGVSQALGHGGHEPGVAAAQFTVSESGLLLYAPGGTYPATPQELLLVGQAGRTQPLPGFDKPLVSAQMRYSPDGRQLAFVEQFQTGLVWLFDVERQTYRVLSEGGLASSPVWSPDGSRLAVAWSETWPLHLWLAPVDGGEWKRLTGGEQIDWPVSWSPDGRFLAFVRAEPSTGNDIWLYRFEERDAMPFLITAGGQGCPVFSPDGGWLAYDSDESGQREVYVTSFPEREKTLTVSRAGGQWPAWSRDGETLFYHSLPSPEDGRRTMMAVPVRTAPGFSLGQPRALFRLPERLASLWPMRSYDLHPDGRRFVIARWLEGTPEPPITRLTIVHNWLEELKRLVPTD